MNMAQQMGGIEPLLDSFFGFMRRKTDFFVGAMSGEAAEEQVMKAFSKNKARSEEDVRERAAKEKKRKAEEEKRRQRIEADKLAKQQARPLTPRRTQTPRRPRQTPRRPKRPCLRRACSSEDGGGGVANRGHH